MYFVFLTFHRGKENMKTNKCRISKKKVKQAISGSYGIVTSIAKRSGCTRRALYYFLDRPENKDLRSIIEEEKESLLDMAENNLITAIKSRDKNERKWSTMFILNTRGAKRGYGNKNDNVHKNFDVPGIMKELENSLPLSLSFVEKLANGEDIGVVYSEFKYFLACNKSDKVTMEKDN